MKCVCGYEYVSDKGDEPFLEFNLTDSCIVVCEALEYSEREKVVDFYGCPKCKTVQFEIGEML